MYFLLLPLISAVFFSGCMSHSKVLALYPNKYVHSSNKVNAKIYLDRVKSFESVKSTNIPVLLADGKLFTDKNFIWLRPPAELIEEYLRMIWLAKGGELSSEKKEDNTLTLSVQNCYIDQSENRFYIELAVQLNHVRKTIKKDSNPADLVNTVLAAIDDIIEFSQLTAEKKQ